MSNRRDIPGPPAPPRIPGHLGYIGTEEERRAQQERIAAKHAEENDPLNKLERALANATVLAQGITNSLADHPSGYVRAITHNLQRQIDESIGTLEFLRESLATEQARAEGA